MSNSDRQKMVDALLKFKRQHGHAAMRSLIERTTGVSAMSEIPRTKYAAVMAACTQKSPAGQFGDADAIFKRFNPPKDGTKP